MHGSRQHVLHPRLELVASVGCTTAQVPDAAAVAERAAEVEPTLAEQRRWRVYRTSVLVEGSERRGTPCRQPIHRPRRRASAADARVVQERVEEGAQHLLNAVCALFLATEAVPAQRRVRHGGHALRQGVGQPVERRREE